MSLLTLPIPKTVRELITAMEALHPPKGPYKTSRGPTEEVFITFRPGPVPEGESITELFYTAEAAIRAFWFEFIRYSQEHKGEKLYWRMKPMIDATLIKVEDMSMTEGGKLTKGWVNRDVFMVRARLYLSNRPILSRDIEAECLGLRRTA